MSNLTANLTVTSANLLATPVNISASTSAINDGYGKMGKIKIQSGEKASLTEFKCGPKGAYVYVKSPSANPANVAIKIFKEENTITSIIFDADQIANTESFITLHPGDFAWVPLSSLCRSLYATTTNGGESTLEFMYVDRGGNWGESVLNVVSDYTNWFYFVTDVQSGEPGQIYSLDISYNAYDFYQISFVQDGGYVIEFNKKAIKGGSVLRKIFFVSADGVMIPDDIPMIYQIKNLTNSNFEATSSGSSSWIGANYANASGSYQSHTNNPVGYAKAYVLVYTENYNVGSGPGTPTTKSKLAYFDGNEIFYHDLPNLWNNQIDFILENSWDASTQDGTICLYFGGNGGDTRFPNKEFLMLVNKTQHIILDVFGNESYVESYLSINSNVICLIESATYDDRCISLRLIDTKGNILQNIYLWPITIYGYEVHFYGKGNIQLILQSEYNNLCYMINYSESLNRILGGNLDWTEEFGYNIVTIYNNNYPLVDFEAPYSNYEGGSIGIIFHNEYSRNDNMPANVQVTNCVIHWVIGDGINQYYNFVDDFGIGNWISMRGAGQWNGSHALKNNIIIPISVDDQMLNLSLSSAGVTSRRLPYFDQYEGYINTNNLNSGDYYGDWQFRALSDETLFYWLYTTDGWSNYVVIDKDLNEIAQFSQYGQYLWNTRSRNGCLLVRTPNWNTNVGSSNEHSWLFTESTGEFTDPQRYYAQRRNSNYARSGSVNDGRILLISPYNYSDNNSGTFIGRLLSKDGISNEFEFPIDRQGWNNYYTAQLGKSSICYYYQNENREYIFNVYDLNFNLLNSYNSGITNLTMYGIDSDYGAYTNGYGDRFFFRLNGNGYYYFLMITPTSSSITKISESSDNYVQYNDIMWNYLQ